LRKAARKDSAVHVSLSSDSLVKQPGTLRLRRSPTRAHGFQNRGSHTHGPERWPRRWPRAKAQKPAPSTRGREHGHEHGPMFGHRVNSEGLRGRAIAPGGSAPKKGYIGFGRRFCQPFRGVKQAQKTWFCVVLRLCVYVGNATPAFCDARRYPTSTLIRGLRRTAATFLRRSLVNSLLSRRGGKRQHHLSF
jgi:hypothetical protein